MKSNGTRSRLLAAAPLHLGLASAPIAAQSIQWTSDGPTPFVAAVALDPVDPATRLDNRDMRRKRSSS